jgi:hypothetical protein
MLQRRIPKELCKSDCINALSVQVVFIESPPAFRFHNFLGMEHHHNFFLSIVPLPMFVMAIELHPSSVL